MRTGSGSPTNAVPLVTVDRLERKLLAQADVFDDPRAYRAGVEDALEAVRAALDRAAAQAVGTTRPVLPPHVTVRVGGVGVTRREPTAPSKAGVTDRHS